MNEKIILKWAVPQPANFAPFTRELQGASKRINERTNGQVTVEISCGGELVPITETYKAVASGKVDIGWDYGGYNRNLLYSSAAQLPIWPSGQAGCAFTKQVLDKYVRSEMAADGVVPLVYQISNSDDYGLYLNVYHAELFCNKVYTSLNDLKGARILSQNDTSSVFLSLLGIVPVMIPSMHQDVLTALTKNQIDGIFMSCYTAEFVNVEDLMTCCVQLHYPQSEDNYTVINKKTYDTLPTDIRNIVTEEVRNWETFLAMDRYLITHQGREFWDARIKAGLLKSLELTPSEKAFCKQQMEEPLVDGWVKKQVAAGLKDARAYMDDLLKTRDVILALGLPQYTGAID